MCQEGNKWTAFQLSSGSGVGPVVLSAAWEAHSFKGSTALLGPKIEAGINAKAKGCQNRKRAHEFLDILLTVCVSLAVLCLVHAMNGYCFQWVS